MSSKKIVLKSSDGEFFEVDEAVAIESQTIAHMVEDGCIDNGVPLPNVTSRILAKVIEYCKKHVEAAAAPKSEAVDGSGSSDDELKAWDAEFMKIDQSMIFELSLAANYLNIKELLDLTCQTIAAKKTITESVGWERRTVTLSLSGNLVSDSYNTFKATITVTPKEDEADGSRVVWTVEFEKIRHDIEDPVWIIDILLNYLKETDGNLNI